MFKTPPYRHQQREFDLHRDDPARALIWQMRSGKSKAMVDLACHLWKACEIDGVVVVAPNNVHTNWLRRQVPEHSWDSVAWTGFAWSASQSHKASYDLEFRAHCQERRRLAWYMVNVEALGLSEGRRYLADFFRSRWRILLVVDEVHSFRGPNSKRFKAITALAPRAPYRRILSGTPLDNSPLHAYSEFSILLPGALGFKSFKAFREHFARVDRIYVRGKSHGRQRQREAVVRYQNLDELRSRIAAWSSVVLRSDCDDMPALLPNLRHFELAPVQKRLHNQLVTGVLARLDSGELIPPAEGGVLMMRLQQIASGFTKDGDSMVRRLMPLDENPRCQALLGTAAECVGKFIVWCRFREDVAMAMEVLRAAGYGPVDYFGGTTQRQRPVHEEAFRSDPKCRALVGQFQAGGQGLDFSAARDIIWFSHTSDLLMRRQADDRATAVGSHDVVVTDLVAEGSNDDRLLESLRERRERSEFLTGEGLRNYLQLIK